MLSRIASPAIVAIRPAEVDPVAPALSVAIPLPTALSMLVSVGVCRLAEGGPDASIDWSALSIDSNVIEPTWACVSLNPEGWCDGQTVSVSWHTTLDEVEAQQACCEEFGGLGSHLVTTAERAGAFLRGDDWFDAFV